MSTWHYYLSESPNSVSPPSVDLSTIEAASPEQAVVQLLRQGRLPPKHEQLWAHFLVWTSLDGVHRGFKSIRLAGLITAEARSEMEPSAEGGPEPPDEFRRADAA